MKVLLYNQETLPSVQMECDCGEVFWVDPSTEENLEYVGRRLLPKCPECGRVDE